ncbi:TonB-dependent receptor [Seongchinamella unica]|uniref:TonB-dependent receptor n=1 Tax=Seongchinamella unica TaxID=2547392 RepID=A0A4R5LQ35_9GAMM|nr:TonB-dependent receptor [Seongchinamella unica]TDG12648.1 TonB-dependent receptor [Seongchinamella unica]
MKTIRIALAGIAGSLTCFPILPVLAQDSASAGSQAATSLMEEILVTARKREQSLQDVSVSVMALPENLLRDAFITDSEDLTHLVPSLNLQKGGNPRNSSFNIRGVGTQSFSAGVEPSVSTVVDGVVMGSSGMAFIQLLDVQRVEVLRGPQGTLFGKNSTAGVVHIITQEPSDEFTASVAATAIESDQWQGGFTAAGPVGDSVGYRLTGFYERDEGYIDNVFDGSTYNDRDSWSLRGKLRWDVSENLSLLWSSDYSDMEGDCCVATLRSLEPWPVEPPNNQGQVDATLERIAPVVPSERNTRVSHDYPDYLAVTNGGHSLTVDWELGHHTLTSITAYRDFEQQDDTDADMQPGYYLNVWQSGSTDQDQWTQELRLTSPADQRISYVAGLYYFQQNLERSFSRYIFNGPATSNFEVDTLNYAAFGEATWNMTQNWRLVLGARYTEDDLEFEFERVSDSVFQPSIPRYSKQVDADDLSGKLALEWDAAENMLLYTSFVQGYKGPAFNITSGSTPDNTRAADPETSASFELGLKSSWLDSRLVVNATLFYTEYDDFQAQATESELLLDENGNTQDQDGDGVPDRKFSFILTNVGEVTTQGLEIDLMAQASENLSLFGGLALIDAEIDSYPGGPCSFGQEFRGVGFRGQPSCADSPAQQDLSGGELPFSPDWKVTLAANYLIPLPSQAFDLVLKGNYRVQDDILFAIDQDQYQRQDSYGVLDVSVMLRDKRDRYTAALFVKNVLDEHHVSAIGAQNENLVPNGYAQFFPRTHEQRVGLELRYNWY